MDVGVLDVRDTPTRTTSAWFSSLGPRPSSCLTANSIRSEEHTSELQSLRQLVCRLLLEKKNTKHVWSGQGDVLRSESLHLPGSWAPAVLGSGAACDRATRAFAAVARRPRGLH